MNFCDVTKRTECSSNDSLIAVRRHVSLSFKTTVSYLLALYVQKFTHQKKLHVKISLFEALAEYLNPHNNKSQIMSGQSKKP